MKNISRLTLAVIAMFTVMAFTSINAIRFEKPIKIDIKKAELIPINSELKLIEIEML